LTLQLLKLMSNAGATVRLRIDDKTLNATVVERQTVGTAGRAASED
jgi:hypothetical protein